jgi:hypothetical protein
VLDSGGLSVNLKSAGFFSRFVGSAIRCTVYFVFSF